MNAYPDDRHAWDRTRGLARRLGVDLPRAVVDGWLTRRELDGLVGACSVCGQDGCKTASAPSAAACGNTTQIEALRL